MGRAAFSILFHLPRARGEHDTENIHTDMGNFVSGDCDCGDCDTVSIHFYTDWDLFDWLPHAGRLDERTLTAWWLWFYVEITR